MAAATTAAVVGIAVGVNALSGGAITKGLGFGGDSDEQARQQQERADPFSSHRKQLGNLYSDYLTGKTPTDPNQMPGYSSFESGVLDPAMEATKRSMAASGQMQSGNEAIALQKLGQQGYYSFMTDYLNRLSTGSGAAQGPATAAGMGYTAGQNYDQQMMQGIGGIMQGASSLYRGSNGGSSNVENPPVVDNTYQYPPYYATPAY